MAVERVFTQRPTDNTVASHQLTWRRNRILSSATKETLGVSPSQALKEMSPKANLWLLLAAPFRPVPRVNLLGRHEGSLEAVILVHVKDRAALKAVLSNTSLRILPVVGFAGSGKTDLMATILIAVGAGPAIVCTPTHAAASTSRHELMSQQARTIIIRGFSWNVDELRALAQARKHGTGDATHDNWEHSIDWMQRIFRAQHVVEGSQPCASSSTTLNSSSSKESSSTREDGTLSIAKPSTILPSES